MNTSCRSEKENEILKSQPTLSFINREMKKDKYAGRYEAVLELCILKLSLDKTHLSQQVSIFIEYFLKALRQISLSLDQEVEHNIQVSLHTFSSVSMQRSFEDPLYKNITWFLENDFLKQGLLFLNFMTELLVCWKGKLDPNLAELMEKRLRNHKTIFLYRLCLKYQNLEEQWDKVIYYSDLFIQHYEIHPYFDKCALNVYKNLINLYQNKNQYGHVLRYAEAAIQKFPMENLFKESYAQAFKKRQELIVLMMNSAHELEIFIRSAKDYVNSLKNNKSFQKILHLISSIDEIKRVCFSKRAENKMLKSSLEKEKISLLKAVCDYKILIIQFYEIKQELFNQLQLEAAQKNENLQRIEVELNAEKRILSDEIFCLEKNSVQNSIVDVAFKKNQLEQRIKEELFAKKIELIPDITSGVFQGTQLPSLKTIDYIYKLHLILQAAGLKLQIKGSFVTRVALALIHKNSKVSLKFFVNDIDIAFNSSIHSGFNFYKFIEEEGFNIDATNSYYLKASKITEIGKIDLVIILSNQYRISKVCSLAMGVAKFVDMNTIKSADNLVRIGPYLLKIFVKKRYEEVFFNAVAGKELLFQKINNHVDYVYTCAKYAGKFITCFPNVNIERKKSQDENFITLSSAVTHFKRALKDQKIDGYTQLASLFQRQTFPNMEPFLISFIRGFYCVLGEKLEIQDQERLNLFKRNSAKRFLNQVLKSTKPNITNRIQVKPIIVKLAEGELLKVDRLLFFNKINDLAMNAPAKTLEYNGDNSFGLQGFWIPRTSHGSGKSSALNEQQNLTILKK
jgi:hypothetical protein